MIACVYFVTAVLVLTKLGDVASTLHGIEHADRETNPLARRMMTRIGTVKAVWIVLFLALVIIGICAVAALNGGWVNVNRFSLLRAPAYRWFRLQWRTVTGRAERTSSLSIFGSRIWL